jgi:GSH-dependent disulfide-bond oxidoreductase
MIRLYSWPTPNGQKVQILLEELGLDYAARPVNILRGEQFSPEFLTISPNNKVPAIVDEEAGVSVFETGAIMLYLADKAGKLVPANGPGRVEVLEWLFFQCSNLGPMLGQVTHFKRYAAEPVPYAIERYSREALRLYGVMERRLESRDWLAAGIYTIADVAAFPWICRHRRQGVPLEQFPAVKRWLDSLSSRPAVLRGMDVLKDAARETPLDTRAHDTLFGPVSSK